MVAYDILNAKLGMPCVPQSFIDTAIEDHRKAICEDRPAPNEEEEWMLGEVEERISEIVSSVFRRVRFRHRDAIPSLGACYENGCAHGGALGQLALDFGCYEEQDGSVDSDGDVRQWCRGSGVSDKTIMRVIAPEYLVGMVYVEGEVKELRLRDFRDLVCDFQNWVDREVQARLPNPIFTNPIPIPEPLKVRVITKGQAAEYYRAIELQKHMHSALKQHEMFEYIGHPIDDDSWARTFSFPLSEDQFYVSGDYKAATDNLRPELSEFTWRAICGQTIFNDWALVGENNPLYLLGKNCLTNHQLGYPDRSDPNGPGRLYQQKWGQLMGSPMSFPILCIVNAAATLASQGWHYARGLPIKVNGDDIAFVTNQAGYESWGRFTRCCGLEKSVGKNYCSRNFIIMNSQLRRPPRKWFGQRSTLVERVMPDHWGTLGAETSRCQVPAEEGLPSAVEIRCHVVYPPVRDQVTLERPDYFPWSLCGFVNQSILYNRVKKGMEAGQARSVLWTDLASLSHEMLSGMEPRYHMDLYKVFFSTYSPVIGRLPAFCDKWTSSSLGGVGLALPSGFKADQLHSKMEEGVAQIVRKRAAGLACDPPRRLSLLAKLQSQNLVGPYAEIFHDVMSQVNGQVPKVIGTKPLLREQKTQVGGLSLLGYLLHGSIWWWKHVIEARAHPDGTDQRAVVARVATKSSSSRDALGGRQAAEAMSQELFLSRTRVLNYRYSRFMSRYQWTSLHPMSWEKCCGGFQEHLRAYSMIEILREDCSDRWQVG
jgi:hypothetical protein